MRAVVYRTTGDPDVLELVDRPEPDVAPGEVKVRVARSGVNPTDWRSRRGSGPSQDLPFPEVVPGQDGSGTIVAVGSGVEPARVGERVWIWEAAWQRPGGTAQEIVVVPSAQAVLLPDSASFDLGASIGIPALTAHRALTAGEDSPGTLAPAALSGAVVLVAGGAGAVGHAAIELARWAGATVIATVSSPAKADLARQAGAHHVVDYRAVDATDAVRGLAPGGVHTVVEVAPAANAALDRAVLAHGGVVAAYANDADDLAVPIRASMQGNLRYQFVLVYTVPELAKRRAVAGVAAALADGALRAGDDAGLPLHHFPLERTADAHAAVEASMTGKVLIDVS